MAATRWWMIQASAPLQTVATQNYACYGRGGVPRHDGPASAPPAAATHDGTSDPAALCVELIIRASEDADAAGADSAIRFANLDVTLTPQQKDAQRVIWSTYDPDRHLQTIWVWDFFRLLSHVVLRVAETPAGDETDLAWENAQEGLRAAVAGDLVTLNVRSVCGDIHQTHTLTNPALLWDPTQVAAK